MLFSPGAKTKWKHVTKHFFVMCKVPADGSRSFLPGFLTNTSPELEEETLISCDSMESSHQQVPPHTLGLTSPCPFTSAHEYRGHSISWSICGLHLTSSVLGIKSKNLSLWHPNSKTFFLLLFFIYSIWPVYFICGLNYALTTYCSTYKQQPSHLSSQIHSHKQTASLREAGIMPI